MASGGFADRPITLRILGSIAVFLMVMALVATYAIYNDAFSRRLPVTVEAESAGLDLMAGADVKVRGVFVGEVIEVYSKGTSAVIELQIDRSRAKQIPSDVQAVILPTTLFGPKFVDLQPVGSSATTSLQANQVIETARLPVEVEDVLNNLYPILTTLKPAQLSNVINAVASALDGRGEKFGETIETLSTYMEKFAPLSDTFVSDIRKLGEVADVYSDVMPDLGSAIGDFTVTSNTIVAKRAQLAALYSNVSEFSLTADRLLRTSGDDYVAFAQTATPTLDMLATYSPTLKCVIEGAADIVDRLVDPQVGAFRDKRAQVSVQFAPRQATGYTLAERPKLPSLNSPDAQTCAQLGRRQFDATNVAPAPPKELMSRFGIDGRHRKTTDEAVAPPQIRKTSGGTTKYATLMDEAEREGSTAIGVGAVGSDADRAAIDGVVEAATGTPAGDVSGLANITIGSSIRGTEVSFY